MRRRFWSDERGATIFMVAPMLLLLVGMAALSVDTMHAVTTKEHLRTIAEAAASAGVAQLPDKNAARSAALAYAQVNFKGAAPGDVVLEDDIVLGVWTWDQATQARVFNPIVAESDFANAVRVMTNRTTGRGNSLATFFGRSLGVASFDLTVPTIAARIEGHPCLVALDPTGSKAFELKSNSAIHTVTCGIDVHSTAADALFTDSNAQVSVAAAEICVEGGHHAGSNSVVSPAPETGCTPEPDPFANLVIPSNAAAPCDATKPKEVDTPAINPQTLTPGVYCDGLYIKNNTVVTFSSGVYIIRNGKLKIDSNSVASGTGVGFFLTGPGATLEFTSNTTINFSANAGGDMKGLIFFQDPAFGAGDTHKIDSNNVTHLDGAVYLPKATLNVNSNSQLGSATDRCMMFVTYRMAFDSNASLAANTDYSQCAVPPKIRLSRIVA